MSPLNWQEHPQKHSPNPSSGRANPWFGIAMGLMGLIAGFIIATFIR
jgi:hypothetical protein